jgi:hypothetical protein
MSPDVYYALTAVDGTSGTIMHIGNTSWHHVRATRGAPVTIRVPWTGIVIVSAYVEHPLTKQRSSITENTYHVVDPTRDDVTPNERPARGSGLFFIRSRFTIDGFEPWEDWSEQIDRKFRVAVAGVVSQELPYVTVGDVSVISVNTTGISFQVSVFGEKNATQAEALFSNHYFACPLSNALYAEDVISLGQESTLETNPDGTYKMNEEGNLEVANGIVLSPLHMAIAAGGGLIVLLIFIVTTVLLVCVCCCALSNDAKSKIS